MTARDSVDKAFLASCNDGFLTQHVDFPTHISGNTLDLVLSTDPDVIGEIRSCGRLANGDHDMMEIDLILPVTNDDSTEMLPDFNKADFSKLREFLHEVDWYEELKDQDTENSWTFFKEKLQEMVDTKKDETGRDQATLDAARYTEKD